MAARLLFTLMYLVILVNNKNIFVILERSEGSYASYITERLVCKAYKIFRCAQYDNISIA